MQTDPRLISDVRLLGRDAFIERYGHPFLGITVVEAGVDQQEAAYDTGVHSLDSSDLDLGIAGELNVLAPVQQRRGANEFSFITVGRAGNNDIVIGANSISKCHAMLQSASAGFTVVDAESKNGTLLNGSSLKPRKAQPIASGDILLFAPGITAVFLDAGAAYTWLRMAGI